MSESGNSVLKGGSFLIQETPCRQVFTPEDFTEDHRMIAKAAQDFAEKEVMPRMPDIESQKWDVSKSLMKKAGEIGLLSVDIPEAYGGLGLDKTSSMLVAESLGRTGSFAVTHGGHTGIGTLPIVYFGTEEQKKKYLPKLATAEMISSYCLTEPNAGSDALSIRTTATLSQDGKHYLLNGNKVFLTNAAIADIYITFAKINGEQMTGFILEKELPGITLGSEEKKMGIKGSSNRTMILDNCKVPVENLLGQIGKGHKIAFNILNMGRFKLGAAVIGGAKSVITDSVRYANQRKQFGKSISSFGMIKHKLGEMAIRAFAGESMVYRTAGLIDGRLSALSDASTAEQVLKGIEEYAVECSIIKVYASEILSYVVDEGVQIFGGYGFIEEYPVARPYRDSRVNRIFEGTNEINRLLAVDMLLKRGMKGEIPLMQAAQKVADDVLAASGSDSESADQGALSEEKRLLIGAKKATLFCAALAFQKYMARLEEEQELVGKISDMLMEVYAMESVTLRVEKGLMQSAEAYLCAARAFVNDAVLRLEVWAKEILAAVSEGDMLRTHLAILRKLFRHLPVNTVTLRRKVADHLIAADRYAL